MQNHLKSEHLLYSLVKLDKKNDEAGYRTPMKATSVQHLHESRNTTEFCFMKSNHAVGSEATSEHWSSRKYLQ